MVIDFHCHAFPEKIAQSAIAALERSSGQKAARGGDAQSLLDSMKRAGIDYSVVLSIATKPTQVESVNRFAAKCSEMNGLIGFGSVHPEYEDYKGALRSIKALGLPGIKLHPDFQGAFIDDQRMVAIMQEAASLGLMILVHAGMDVSFPRMHRCTPQRLSAVLPQLRGATLIAAHLGGFRYLDDVERYLVGSEIYIDTSLAGWFDRRQVERILQNHDPDRILFGTDSPWDDQAQALSRFRDLSLPQALFDKILSENACRLLKNAGVNEFIN